MKKEYREAIEGSPVIAAVKNFESLEKSLTCGSRIIFILFGDICNISDIVARIKAAGKLAIVHIDLITGLAPKEIAVDFIHQCTDADGIISAKPALVKYATKLSLFTVLRFFVIDSLALSNIEKQLQYVKPDVVEVLPQHFPCAGDFRGADFRRRRRRSHAFRRGFLRFHHQRKYLAYTGEKPYL